MAAVDINAQREKIQREIEALERSLGPDVASIDVVVSDSSLESDDDNLGTEDNLEGDLLKFQHDFEWEDGCSKTEMCLQMNLVYQAVIEEKIQEVELLIAQNKEQQDEMLWQIAGHREQKPADGKASSFYLHLGHFMKPYFKDKVTGLGPPANQDMQERTLQGIKPFASLYHRKWKSENKLELRNAVMSDSLQKMLQPKILKLEYLQTKVETASDINKKILEKQIKETECEIDDINQLSEEALLGKRTDERDWEKISNINFEGLHSAEKLRKIWQNSEHPHVSKAAWEEDEVSKLLEIAAKHNCANWKAIAQELGTNRTGFQCLQKYQFTNKDFKRKEFTKEEDEMLTDLVQQMRVGNHIPYRKISYFMEGRYPMQLLCRWSKTLDPNLKKGSWSPSEDELLLKAVAKYGEKEWYKIQCEVPGRSDVQCRERYMKGLRGDVKKGRWNAKEEKQLWELIEKHGVGNWSKLASEFPNRNGAQCLSKWKVLMGIRKKRWHEQKQKRKLKEVESDIDTFSSGSSTSSDDSEMEFDSSEDERKVVPKAAKSNDYGIFNLDLWVPRQQFLEPSNKTKRSRGSGKACSVIGQKKIKEGSLQFNTILKGIAYPHSTDTVIENVDEFLKEADESRRDILHIREETVQYILRRNSKLHHGKPVHRAEVKLPNSSEASDHQTEEVSPPQESPQHHRNERNTIDRKLLLAVTPWVGNVFIPLSTSFGRPRKSSTRADLLGEKVCAITLTSTPLFTFFIQLFQINAEGCLQIIRVRKSQQTNLHHRAPSSASKLSGSAPASRDPTSPPSSLVRALSEMRPVASGLTAPQVRAIGAVNARPLRPVQKPKTVFELLREKRMRESIAQTPAQPRVVIPGAIQLNANEMGQGPMVRLPLASSLTENRLWPVVPTTTAGLPRLPIPRLSTVVSGVTVANPSMPITWVVTPQGLVPLKIQALKVAGPNPEPPGVVQTPVSSPIQTEVIKTPLLPFVKSEVKEHSNGHGSSTGKPMLSTDSGDQSPSGLASTAQPCSSKSVSDSSLLVPSTPPSTTATTSSQVPGPRPMPAPPSSPVSNNSNVLSSESRIPPALATKTNPVVQLPSIQSADNAGSAPDVTESASALPATPQTPPRGSDKSALDLSLVALEDQAEVKEWLKGSGGVENPSLKTNMAYLPPSSCTLKTLSRLLLQKRALEESAFKLLPPAEDEERSPSKKVEMVNDLVTQKLKDNPAFLTLRQRFLSAFTVSAFLAALPPGQVKTTMDVHKEDCKLKEEDMSDFTDSEINDDQNDGEDVEENSQGTSSNAGLPEAPLRDATGQGEPDEQPASIDGPASDRSAVRRTTRKRAHPQKWT